MNALLWIAQLLLALAFLVAAAGKLFAYEKVVKVVESRTKGRAVPMSRAQAVLVALAEGAGALVVIVPNRILPFHVAPPHLVTLIAASWLALIMVAASIYHASRREPASPSITLFLLALFIIVGRWPR